METYLGFTRKYRQRGFGELIKISFRIVYAAQMEIFKLRRNIFLMFFSSIYVK